MRSRRQNDFQWLVVLLEQSLLVIGLGITGLLRQEAKTKDLQEEISSLRDKKTQLELDLLEANSQRVALKNQLDSYARQVSKLALECVQLRITLALSQSELDATKRRRSTLDTLNWIRHAAAVSWWQQSRKPVNLPPKPKPPENREKGSGEIARVVLGLPANLRRVVFVIDRSYSMKGGRWEFVLKTIEEWLRHLPIEAASVVVFSTTVEAYPLNGAMLDLSGPDRETNLELLVSRVRQLTPDGATNTLAALKEADKYDHTAILLFSDGRANVGVDLFNGDQANKVVEYLRTRLRRTPVSVIAMGNYFDNAVGGFLLDIARTTKGTFIGR